MRKRSLRRNGGRRGDPDRIGGWGVVKVAALAFDCRQKKAVPVVLLQGAGRLTDGGRGGAFTQKQPTVTPSRPYLSILDVGMRKPDILCD